MSHRCNGSELVQVTWYYVGEQDSPAQHHDKVQSHMVSTFVRQLISVADATYRTIHIELEN